MLAQVAKGLFQGTRTGFCCRSVCAVVNAIADAAQNRIGEVASTSGSDGGSVRAASTQAAGQLDRTRGIGEAVKGRLFSTGGSSSNGEGSGTEGGLGDGQGEGDGRVGGSESAASVDKGDDREEGQEGMSLAEALNRGLVCEKDLEIVGVTAAPGSSGGTEGGDGWMDGMTEEGKQQHENWERFEAEALEAIEMLTGDRLTEEDRQLLAGYQSIQELFQSEEVREFPEVNQPVVPELDRMYEGAELARDEDLDTGTAKRRDKADGMPWEVRLAPEKPLHLEVNHRTGTVVYLYPPQRLVLPVLIDFDVVMRPPHARKKR